MELLERMERKITKTDTCWLWNAGKPKAYGTVLVDGKARPAHRVYYELTKGEIPEGLVIDHLCRTPSCVNPEHLEPVTHQMNVQRGAAGDLRHLRKPTKLRSHCKQGHAMTPENTYVNVYKKKNWTYRQCRTCVLKWSNERKRRLRELKATNKLDRGV